MKKFRLISITTESSEPSHNIPRVVSSESGEKAALSFAAYAFSGKRNKIIASVKVQNENGNITKFNVVRKPIQKSNKFLYKHYIQ